MKSLGMAENGLLLGTNPVAVPKYITVPFEPGGILHFGDDGSHAPSVRGKTIKQVQWTEVVSKGSQLSQESNWPIQRDPGFALYKLPNTFRQRLARTAEMIGSQETGRTGTAS